MDVSREELTGIIARAQQGEKEAFNTLYHLYLSPLYRYVFMRVRNKEDAEDIVQETFLRLYEALPRYRDERANMLPYLFTVARNLIINHGKKKRPDPYVPEDLDRHASVDDTARTTEHEDTERALRTLLSQLTETEREVIELRFFGERSYGEIATITEKREDAIRQHVTRGLKKMRELSLDDPQFADL